MKYKVGDRVRVRSDLEGNKEYGGWYTLEGMVKMRGEIVTIRGVGSSAYELEENDLMWTDEMLEPVEEELTAEEAIKIFGKICCETRCTDECPIYKAKKECRVESSEKINQKKYLKSSNSRRKTMRRKKSRQKL